MKVLALIAALVLASAAIAPIAAAQQGRSGGAEPSASLPDLEDEVMCPVCGVALGLAESSPQAERIRAFIRRRIAEGMDKDEIKDALAEEFGPEILAVPEDDSGFEVIGVALPAALIGGAVIGLAIGLRRWRNQGPGPGPGGGPAGGSPAGAATDPDPADAERLDEDLSRYDL